MVVNGLDEVGENWRIIFRPHPREEDYDKSLRENLLLRQKTLNIGGSLAELVVAVDLSVMTLNTDLIAAAYLGKPVIYMDTCSVRQRAIEHGVGPVWFPARAGACWRERDIDEMTKAIQDSLDEKAVAVLQARQKIVYPTPEHAGQTTEEKIMDYIERLMASK